MKDGFLLTDSKLKVQPRMRGNEALALFYINLHNKLKAGKISKFITTLSKLKKEGG